jgi:hypothetical protein
VNRRVSRGLIALTLLAGIIFPASNALAGSAPLTGLIGVRLIAAPTDPASDSFARSHIVEHPAPGASVVRRVEISNTTDSTASISVYAAAAAIHLGAFEFAPGHTANDLTRWTSLSQHLLRLAPGANAIETVTINVPRDASTGERDAVIWAEVAAPTTGGVTLVNRVGVRMYVSIGRGGAPGSDFAISSPTAEHSTAGAPLVGATVTNTGQSTLNLGGTLTLSNGPGAVRTTPIGIELQSPLAPGASQRVTIPLDKRLPTGSWRATIRLHNATMHRSATATITFSAANTRSDNNLIVAAILLTLLALTALAVWLSRRLRRSPTPVSVGIDQ